MKKLYRILSLFLICAGGHLAAQTTNPDLMNGIELLQKKQYEKAIEAFNLALKGNESNPFIWERRGYAFYCLKNYYQSINDYTAAIIIAPSQPLFLMQRSLAYHATGNINAMKNDLITAAKMGEPHAQELLRKYNISW